MDSSLYDLKQYKRGLRRAELAVKCLLYADDQVLLAPSASGQQEMINKRNEPVNKRDMKVNVGKSKVMVFDRGENTPECDTLIEGEKVTQGKEFVYLGNLFTNGGKHDRNI
ncbi:hypothetical protein EVAR_87061_1 [Eumeta japonica]|uniref:Reverse transcriptase domain-containing protein n=1 Tax=Eumeta variegata TaxID=151549 RepID=A0A4C1VQH2_EUMVA|nr:hypothetical protein EVAR_87061_1 [Eumeta japonica]